ncbi:MAG: hypothetical protein KJO44_07570, partial [Gemmatimonadetes bacterium]|nr:hypothetical protein [Gemmatimonadota bacterium]
YVTGRRHSSGGSHVTRRQAALPFILEGKEEVLGISELTSTKDTIHGLLRLDGDKLVIQWRLTIKIEHLTETDEEHGDVNTHVLPLDSIVGVALRHRWWELWLGPRLVLTATDMLAFEHLTGEEGLPLSHPAELAFRLRRRERLAGEEFVAEMILAMAELEVPSEPSELGGSPDSRHLGTPSPPTDLR